MNTSERAYIKIDEDKKRFWKSLEFSLESLVFCTSSSWLIGKLRYN